MTSITITQLQWGYLVPPYTENRPGSITTVIAENVHINNEVLYHLLHIISLGTTMCGIMMWDGKLSNHTFSYYSSVASLPVWPHCVNVRRIRCQADLNSFPLELEETTGTPPYYGDEDYPAGPEINEPLPERSNWHGSESLWRLMSIMVLH